MVISYSNYRYMVYNNTIADKPSIAPPIKNRHNFLYELIFCKIANERNDVSFSSDV